MRLVGAVNKTPGETPDHTSGYADVELDIYDVKLQTMVRIVYFNENPASDASSLFLWCRNVLVFLGLCVADGSLERLAEPQASTM